MDVSHLNGEVSKMSEKLEKSLSMDDKMETYHRFIQDGKDAARQGDMHKALEFFKRAHNIHHSQKLEGRIKKIEELISQNDSEDEDDEEFVNVNDSGLMLFKELHDKLYDYQRSGVAFMYSLYRDGRKGGILADDMGLGKTIQVISFLSGMYDNELVKHTLLVMPTSLITNWTKEFAKWTPGMRVKEFHGASKGERTRNLEKVQRRGGVIITTYTMLMNNWQQLSSYQGREFTWDYMILDEAHKIKTSTTKTAKSASAVPSKNRILLTGTPVQNNLREMWALFDFACHGTLLGTAKTFKTEYENPITRAREKDATPGEKALGSRMSENLMAIIKPYFLRRTKSEVQKKKMNGTDSFKEGHSDKGDDQNPNVRTGSGAVMPKLTRKNDLIVWTYLSAVQEDIYRQFISLDHIKELLLTTRSPLAELTILKKLCDHPRLLSAGAIAKLGLKENESPESEDTETDTNSIASVSEDTLISESGKLVFLVALLERLRQEGHRTLVFAHYRKVLDIIEHILGNRGFKVLRMDGTITQIAERERRIALFQSDECYSVFLLTTQVGGVGITLTAANRVVIYDPSWNPATDAQAVDRAYRIGQTENVVIYRLITCGTVEEKIYRRQVFKDSLIRQNTGDKKNPFRYFSKQELKELFSLEDTRSSSTQLQLQALHSRHRRTDPELDEHIAHLHAMEMFGISDHDLMFSLDVNHEEAPENQEEQHYIEGRVQKAQELMKAESELQMQLAESMASSTEPAWLRQPVDNNREHKPRNPKSSPSLPQHDSNDSPIVLDLDQSGSEKENSPQNLSKQVIDLTTDENGTEEEHDQVNQTLNSPNTRPVKRERSYLETTSPQKTMEEALVLSDSVDGGLGDVVDASFEKVMDKSEAADEGVTEEEPNEVNQNLNSPNLWPIKGERSYQEATSNQEVMEESVDAGSVDVVNPSVETIMDKSEVVDESVNEEEPDEVDRNLNSPNLWPIKGERSYQEATSNQEVMEESVDAGSGDVVNTSVETIMDKSEVVDEGVTEEEPNEVNQNLNSPNLWPIKGERSYQEATSNQEVMEESVDAGSGDVVNTSVETIMDKSEVVDESVTEEEPNEVNQNLNSPNLWPIKGERSYQEATSNQEVMEESVDAGSGDVVNTSVDEVIDKSEVVDTSVGDSSSLFVTADDEQKLNEASRSEQDPFQMEVGPSGVTPLQNKRHSVPQASNSSFKADASLRAGSGLESYNGNFNLLLEDSELLSDAEQRLLSRLQMERSFDINKSLCENQQKEASRRSDDIVNGHDSDMDKSVDDSFVVTKKKRAAVIYDSDEEEDDDEEPLMKSQLENSFQVLGASTPKSAPSGSTPLRSRKSVGLNSSVASRRSLLQSIIEDMNNHSLMSGEEESDDDYDVSEAKEVEKEEAEEEEEEVEEEVIGSGQDESLELGETVNTEGEEEVEEEEEEETEEEEAMEEEEYKDSGEKMSFNLDESTSDPELSSTERMDQCTVVNGTKDLDQTYDSLIGRGRECYSAGNLVDALDFFVRALDIKSGDPEIQLKTIQLYRELSQRSSAQQS
ncbi:DNA excision repair protein ERCC-6-like isoform X2 [Mugil cephalus]|uniref:DNA excision repair protein ERCC-6-like isoform X2 n=1 Tax=Mugil cephalus TaxID=48193 RepID=UPI001FB78B19|nr:DNA excision repair protein ERCC-6-like isoform X2 [Mugil cephalus]